MHSPHLTPAQLEILKALAAGSSVTAAAAARRPPPHHCPSLVPYRSAIAAALADAISAAADAVHGEICGLSTCAVSTVRKLLEDDDTPLAVRLKAALAGLHFATTTTLPPALRETMPPHLRGKFIKIHHFFRK